MAWLEKIRPTGLLDMAFITVPFALVLGVIPYFIFVVAPLAAGPKSGVQALTLPVVVSTAIAAFLITKGDPALNNLFGQIGFAAQASLIPCGIYLLMYRPPGRGDDASTDQQSGTKHADAP